MPARRLLVGCVLVSLTVFLVVYYALTIESGLLIPESTANSVQNHLRLLLSLSTVKGAHQVDDILRDAGGNGLYFTKTYSDYNALGAPASWCAKSVQGTNLLEYFWINATRRHVGDLSSTQWDRIMTECFSKRRVDRRAHQKVVRSLRQLRDAFASANIPLFAIFGSYLGSIRYHRRMPFDYDYDFAYLHTDKPKVEALLMKLSSEPSNEMRAFGSTLSWSNTKIGLACGRSTWWMYQLPWNILYGRQAVFNGSWLQMHTYHPVPFALMPCATYVDLYNISLSNSTGGSLQVKSTPIEMPLRAISDRNLEYRPLEGTLFRVPGGSKAFQERVYNSSLEMCVPKEGIQLDKGRALHHEDFKCNSLQIPCRLLDRIYPRVYKVSFPEMPGSFELGLDYNRLGKCVIKSVFYNATPI